MVSLVELEAGEELVVKDEIAAGLPEPVCTGDGTIVVPGAVDPRTVVEFEDVRKPKGVPPVVLVDLRAFGTDELLQVAEVVSGQDLDHARTLALVEVHAEKNSGFNDSAANHKQCFLEEKAPSRGRGSGKAKNDRSPETSPRRSRGRPSRRSCDAYGMDQAGGLARSRSPPVQDNPLLGTVPSSGDRKKRNTAVGTSREEDESMRREGHRKRRKIKQAGDRKDAQGDQDAELQREQDVDLLPGKRRGKGPDTSEAGLFEVLTNMGGTWTSDHKRRKTVSANGFPSGWTVCVGLRQKHGRYYFEYRDYKDPQGNTWGSFKEAAAQLVTVTEEDLNLKSSRTSNASLAADGDGARPDMSLSSLPKTMPNESPAALHSIPAGNEDHVHEDPKRQEETGVNSCVVVDGAGVRPTYTWPSFARTIPVELSAADTTPHDCGGQVLVEHVGQEGTVGPSPMLDEAPLQAIQKEHDTVVKVKEEPSIEIDGCLEDVSPASGVESGRQCTQSVHHSTEYLAGKAASNTSGESDGRHKLLVRGHLAVGVSRDVDVTKICCNCPVCGIDCLTERKLRLHIIEFDHMQAFTCEICGQSFKSKSLLLHHRYKKNHARPLTKGFETGNGGQCQSSPGEGDVSLPSFFQGTVGIPDAETTGPRLTGNPNRTNLEDCEDSLRPAFQDVRHVPSPAEIGKLLCPQWPLLSGGSGACQGSCVVDDLSGVGEALQDSRGDAVALAQRPKQAILTDSRDGGVSCRGVGCESIHPGVESLERSTRDAGHASTGSIITKKLEPGLCNLEDQSPPSGDAMEGVANDQGDSGSIFGVVESLPAGVSRLLKGISTDTSAVNVVEKQVP